MIEFTYLLTYLLTYFLAGGTRHISKAGRRQVPDVDDEQRRAVIAFVRRHSSI